MTRSWIAAAMAGGLIALGGAPIEFSFLTMCAPAALLIALEPRPGEVVGAGRSLLLGLVAGFVVNTAVEYWVVELLMDFASFPGPLALLVGALMWFGESLPYMAGALFAAAWMRRGAPGWIAVPACLTVAASISPGLFPWRYGVSQLSWLPYAQVAELGGLPLLDFLVAAVGCGVVDGLRHRRRVAIAIGLAALFVPPLYGALRLHQVEQQREDAEVLRIGVVQPNVGIFEKHDRTRWYDQLLDQRATTRALEAQGAELVVWPETAYRFPVPRSIQRDRDGALGLRQEGVHGPLLVGVVSLTGPEATAIARDATGRRVGAYRTGTGERFNSAMGVSRDGAVVGIVDKVELLAFGEYTPFWEWLPFRDAVSRGMTPGRGIQQIVIAGTRIGTLNCYEDLLYEHVRAQAAADPELWVNLTNNTWFGDTHAPFLHHMNARMRAIETRRDLVRAVNSGVSGHTSATGEDLIRTGSFERAQFVADARRLTGTTPYVRFGDLTTPVLAAWMFAFLWVRRRREAPH